MKLQWNSQWDCTPLTSTVSGIDLHTVMYIFPSMYREWLLPSAWASQWETWLLGGRVHVFTYQINDFSEAGATEIARNNGLRQELVTFFCNRPKCKYFRIWSTGVSDASIHFCCWNMEVVIRHVWYKSEWLYPSLCGGWRDFM